MNVFARLRAPFFWLAAPHRLMLSAVALVGLAHVLFLPPFEGFDEEAHWSSITYIADKGRIPVYGEDPLDASILAYPGPHPYAPTPPFEDARGLNYREFDPTVEPGPHQAVPPRGFTDGPGLNWQAQHPPLYYILVAPIRVAFEGASWTTQFLLLRLTSWGFAFTGLVIGVLAIHRHFEARFAGAAVIAAGWPFLFPQFFPEMARIGNDSLCLLWVGLAWMFLLRHEARRSALIPLVGLGLALGAGLWTKAFFLPITAGIGAYFAWRMWMERGSKRALRFRLRAGALVCGLAGLIGGGWYVYKFLSTGDLTGGDEFIQLGRRTDFFEGLIAHFDIGRFIRGLGVIAGSFAWASTWSLAEPPEVFILGPIVLMLWALARWVLQWRALPASAIAPAFIALPMIAGLIFHTLVRMASDMPGGTPGWYLHILAPAAGLAVAIGFRGSAVIRWLAAYSVVFTVAVWSLQLSMFSGCAAKLGTGSIYTFEGADCFIDPVQLAALGYPMLGVFCAAAGAVCALWAVKRARALTVAGG